MFRFVWLVFLAELLFLRFDFDQAWYDSLLKPSYLPPGYIFGIAWGLLYPLLAYVYYQTLTSPDPVAINLFESQMALNLLWSYVFFSLKNIHLSALIIALMIVLNLAFYQRFRQQWYLLYIGWLCFALIGILDLKSSN
jgi:tryptophan-rich sensory protein